jgi:hypothetical protein
MTAYAEKAISGPHGRIRVVAKVLRGSNLLAYEYVGLADCLVDWASRSLQHSFHRRLDENIESIGGVVALDRGSTSFAEPVEITWNGVTIQVLFEVNLHSVSLSPEVVGRLLKLRLRDARLHLLGHLTHPEDTETAHQAAFHASLATLGGRSG